MDVRLLCHRFPGFTVKYPDLRPSIQRELLLASENHTLGTELTEKSLWESGRYLIADAD